MKILLRTLMILLAAAVVTGATLGALQVPAVQSWISSSQGGERHGPPAGMTAGTTEGQSGEFPAFSEGTDTTAAASSPAGSTSVAAASTDSTAGAADGSTAAASTAAASTAAAAGAPTRPMRGEGGGRPGGNLQGLLEVGKNLGIVVVVSLVIGAAGWVGKRFRPHRPAPAAAA